MATYVLIHGAGDVGWYWHLVERELRIRCHDVVVMDMPVDDDAATLWTMQTSWSKRSVIGART
jgi:23S rRNA C2498 (ribose-2'-O)-methylase RlmM